MSLTVVRLGDVATFVRGITFKPEDVMPPESPGSVACMRTRNVQATLDLSDVWSVSASVVKRHDQYLREGDTLVSTANSWNLVGKCCWVPALPSTATFGGFISVLRGNREQVDSRFLFHWFSSPSVQTTVRSLGQQTTNITNLNVSRCLNLPLQLPCRSQQQRIAEILDATEELRAKRRAALAALGDLTQAIFLDMFGDPATNSRGWQIKRLGEVADVQGGLQVTSARKSYPREVPYLRVANVYRGYLDLREVKTIRATDAEVSRTTLHTDDLLVVEGHGNFAEVGRGALWDASIPLCVHQNHLIRVRFDTSRIVPSYACEALNSAGGRRFLIRAGNTTSGLNTISVSDVRDTPLVVPPIEAQEEFVRRISKVGELTASQRAALAELDALFASLQHRAFRGEL